MDGIDDGIIADRSERRRLIDPRVNTNRSDITEDQLYVAYTRRWYILLVLFILSFSNAMVWICFAPIADFTAEFYDVSLDKVNWFSLVFPIVAVPFSLVASWLLDTMGLRAGLIISALVNVLGAGLRWASAEDVIMPEWRYAVALTGQTIAACAQPIYLIAPAKVAAVWFKDTQRATANMLASMANPLGILCANIIAPFLVSEAKDITFMLMVFTIPAGVGTVLAIFGVCSSTPPSPPTASAEEISYPFFLGLKKVMTNRNFLVLAVCFGAGVGLFTSLSSLLQQILCPWGYSDNFAGICGALVIGFGVVGAAIAGVVSDKTKKFEETAKVSYSIACIACIALALVFQYPNQEILIAAVISVFGLFGFALYPICLELGVESTFPVAEATSAGILVISGQIQSILLILLMQWLADDFTPSFPGVCGGQATSNYRIPMYNFACMAVIGSIVFTIFYRCAYKRLKTEEQLMAEKLQAQRHERLYTHPIFS